MRQTKHTPSQNHRQVGMTQVARICKRAVVSTKPVPVQPGKVHTFSVLDRTVEHSHLKAVYYCCTDTDPGKYKTGELTCMLVELLSAMLTWYPVVTGRLTRDENGHWMVKCNDAGVRAVEATATGSADECLGNLGRVKEIEVSFAGSICSTSLLFTDKMIQELMEMARGSMEEEGVSLSPFDTLSVLFWACISSVRGLKDHLMNMSIWVDARKVLGLDKCYFGNCMVYNKDLFTRLLFRTKRESDSIKR